MKIMLARVVSAIKQPLYGERPSSEARLSTWGREANNLRYDENIVNVKDDDNTKFFSTQVVGGT